MSRVQCKVKMQSFLLKMTKDFKRARQSLNTSMGAPEHSLHRLLPGSQPCFSRTQFCKDTQCLLSDLYSLSIRTLICLLIFNQVNSVGGHGLPKSRLAAHSATDPWVGGQGQELILTPHTPCNTLFRS